MTGRRDFLYVADCKLATTENMAYIHQHGGRFLTVLPRTRGEDGAFRELALQAARSTGDRSTTSDNDEGEIVDRYSVSEPATLSAEGYRLIWYHSTRKAELDAHARHQQVERALSELAELRQKLSSPRTRYRQRAKVAEAVEAILQARGVERWIVTEIKERTTETYRQDGRGRPSDQTRYVKEDEHSVRPGVSHRPRAPGRGNVRRRGLPPDHQRRPRCRSWRCCWPTSSSRRSRSGSRS